MTTQTSTTGVSFLLPHNMMYAGADRGVAGTDTRALPRSGRRGPSGLLARIVTWFAELPARNAAIAELSAMSDRELADIGISRADIQGVVAGTHALQR